MIADVLDLSCSLEGCLVQPGVCEPLDELRQTLDQLPAILTQVCATYGGRGKLWCNQPAATVIASLSLRKANIPTTTHLERLLAIGTDNVSIDLFLVFWCRCPSRLPAELLHAAPTTSLPLSLPCPGPPHSTLSKSWRGSLRTSRAATASSSGVWCSSRRCACAQWCSVTEA